MFNLMNMSCIIHDYNEDLSQLVNGFIMDELSASSLRVQKNPRLLCWTLRRQQTLLKHS